MAWTKGLYGISGKLAESSKSIRGAAQSAAKAAKQSETIKSAGPALGKMARFAMYPAGVGVGIGAGGYVAGMGIGGGIENVKNAMMPKDEKEGGILRTLISIAVLLLLGYGAVKLYQMTKG